MSRPTLAETCWVLALLGASSAAQAHSPYLLPNAFDIVERNHATDRTAKALYRGADWEFIEPASHCTR